MALGTLLFGPPVHLRPGYWLLTRQDYLLPTAVIDDYGQQFDAPECYEWIEARGDAIGILPSGEKCSVFMKEVDLAEMAVFANPANAAHPIVRVDLAIEARALPDGFALTPVEFPITLLARAVLCYRLAPGAFGAVGAAILSQLLSTRRHGWQLTFDQLDDALGV